MRLQRRNTQTIYFNTYKGRLPVVDEKGNYTGEYEVEYSKPKSIRASVSPASGNITLEMFGVNEGYDRIIIIDDVNCKINELSQVWLDGASIKRDPPLYVVKRISKSLNYLSVAVKKVDNS